MSAIISSSGRVEDETLKLSSLPDLPGVKAEDLKLEVEDTNLILQGRRIIGEKLQKRSEIMQQMLRF
jgi:HSP20 family molecular chaperone IbpA